MSCGRDGQRVSTEIPRQSGEGAIRIRSGRRPTRAAFPGESKTRILIQRVEWSFQLSGFCMGAPRGNDFLFAPLSAGSAGGAPAWASWPSGLLRAGRTVTCSPCSRCGRAEPDTRVKIKEGHDDKNKKVTEFRGGQK